MQTKARQNAQSFTAAIALLASLLIHPKVNSKEATMKPRTNFGKRFQMIEALGFSFAFDDGGEIERKQEGYQADQDVLS